MGLCGCAEELRPHSRQRTGSSVGGHNEPPSLPTAWGPPASSAIRFGVYQRSGKGWRVRAPAIRCGFVIQWGERPRVSFPRVPIQLPIPWTLRVLTRRPLSATEELLEVLTQDGEPLVATWAGRLRGRVRDADDLAREIERIELAGGPVARTLAETVRRAWFDFGGAPLGRQVPWGQRPLPLPLD